MVTIEKVKVSWAKVGHMIDTLTKKIVASGIKFDRVVGISRGGLIPGVALSHRLNVPFSAVGVSSYNDETDEQETLVCNTPDVNFEGWCGNVLFVDDLTDSGVTMQFLCDKVSSNRNINVKIATLYHKETSVVTPDFYVEITNKWIVFSWEHDRD